MWLPTFPKLPSPGLQGIPGGGRERSQKSLALTCALESSILRGPLTPVLPSPLIPGHSVFISTALCALPQLTQDRGTLQVRGHCPFPEPFEEQWNSSWVWSLLCSSALIGNASPGPASSSPRNPVVSGRQVATGGGSEPRTISS